MKMSDSKLCRSKLNNIRDEFSKIYSKQDLFDEIDLYRVYTDEWFIERFFINEKDLQKGFLSLLKAMRWKNDFGVYKRNEQYFMREIHQWCDPELFGRDKQGRYILWCNMRNSNFPNLKEFNTFIKQFTVHNIEINDKIVNRNGIIMINFLSGLEIKNFNIDLMLFSNTLVEYYPSLVKCNLVIDMPKLHAKIANWLISIYRKKYNTDQHDIKFISFEQLKDFVDSELIPIEIGGSRISNIKVANNIKSLNELCHFKFSDKTTKCFYKYHSAIMEKMNKTKKKY